MVTAFNSVQYAANPVSLLKQMAHTAKTGGLVGVLVWGPPQSCESGVMFAEMAPLLPPAPPVAPGAIALERTRPTRAACQLAGLTPVAVDDAANPLIYPDLATAIRTQLSSGPAQAAIQNSGLAATRGALTRAFAGSRKPDGTYRQDNVLPVPHRPSLIYHSAAEGCEPPNLEGMRAHFGTVIKERTLQTTDLDWSRRRSTWDSYGSTRDENEYLHRRNVRSLSRSTATGTSRIPVGQDHTNAALTGGDFDLSGTSRGRGRA